MLCMSISFMTSSQALSLNNIDSNSEYTVPQCLFFTVCMLNVARLNTREQSNARRTMQKGMMQSNGGIPFASEFQISCIDKTMSVMLLFLTVRLWSMRCRKRLGERRNVMSLTKRNIIWRKVFPFLHILPSKIGYNKPDISLDTFYHNPTKAARGSVLFLLMLFRCCFPLDNQLNSGQFKDGQLLPRLALTKLTRPPYPDVLVLTILCQDNNTT